MSPGNRPRPLGLALLLDGGTTNTRGWLVAGDRVLARASVPVGVRNVAQGDRARFVSGIRGLVETFLSEEGDARPEYVVAAGMIASDLGLGEVPHVEAPAGVEALAAGARWTRAPEITDLEILLLPGVRSGGEIDSPGQVGATDVMRGEETLTIGLLEGGTLRAGGTLLNLGSHWKAIRTGTDTTVLASRTSLTGELIHAAQTQTVLASSVPPHRPESLDLEWFQAGIAEAANSGLPRALFCVRLLEQRCNGTAEQRLSFLVGALAMSDLGPLVASGMVDAAERLSIAGPEPLASGVQSILRDRGLHAELLTQSEIEEGMVTGLRRIARAVLA